MLGFTLNEDQEMLAKTVKDFATKEVEPKIAELDEKQQFDDSILEKMKELDLLGVCIPEKYGGAGFDYVSLGLACEELEAVDTSLRVILSVHVGLNSMTMLTWANEEQKQKYLAPQARGEKIATFGLTEPNAGSDVRGLQTTAKKEGDHYVLNGEKMWISLADVADHFLIFAWTDMEKKKQKDYKGISCFIVSRDMGIETGTIHGKLGVRAGNTGWIAMNDVKVPAENMMGEEGEGFKIAMSALDNGRYTVAAGATGLVRACRDACLKYSKERETFGNPIGDYQLVKQMIAKMVRDYETSRLLYLKVGWMKNEGLRHTKEVSLAKWVACDASEAASGDAVQLHGAYGFSNEYPVERYYRNCKGAVIYEGTREIQQLMQADYALGNRKDGNVRKELPKYDPSEWLEE
ncbi:acyl-CoA dehydrogenase family protein [Natranaerofaba carboxydovora]|uniref:acyl-CoA dehydrogenase family protein n=1 Tax=Natranaerofaba carboxydovora TaxID=2742683 RepID=UPI001F12BFCE|nr:acyl-CoA dehydrogenase family protein [Natranaerofaba carboxydovora]UMZ74800.1 Acyl-CoA dehydrogenase [Natranaerofaba carboxydovora]